MEWIVFASMALISAFLLTLIIYCCLFLKRKMNEENEQRREIERDSGFGFPDLKIDDNRKPDHQSNQLSVINEGSANVQASRSMLSVSNKSPSVSRQVPGSSINPSPGHQVINSAGQLINSSGEIRGGSFEVVNDPQNPQQLSVHGNIYRSHSSSNIEEQEQQLDRNLVRQHSTPGSDQHQLRPGGGGQQQQQQRHHSGPVVSAGGAHGRRGHHQQQFVQVQEERVGNFREGRDFGAMPPIGSAEAEFQNDFIAVFPMRHLEPQPDLR